MSRRVLFQWSFDQLSYQPSTQMTPVLIGKGRGLTFKKNRRHWRFREYIYIASVSILFFHHDVFLRTRIPFFPCLPPRPSVGPVNSDQSQLDLREARTESGSAGGICGFFLDDKKKKHPKVILSRNSKHRWFKYTYCIFFLRFFWIWNM